MAWFWTWWNQDHFQTQKRQVNKFINSSYIIWLIAKDISLSQNRLSSNTQTLTEIQKLLVWSRVIVLNRKFLICQSLAHLCLLFLMIDKKVGSSFIYFIAVEWPNCYLIFNESINETFTFMYSFSSHLLIANQWRILAMFSFSWKVTHLSKDIEPLLTPSTAPSLPLLQKKAKKPSSPHPHSYGRGVAAIPIPFSNESIRLLQI